MPKHGLLYRALGWDRKGAGGQGGKADSSSGQWLDGGSAGPGDGFDKEAAGEIGLAPMPGAASMPWLFPQGGDEDPLGDWLDLQPWAGWNEADDAFDLPSFTHLPLLLGEDRSKLSKRHGAASVQEYRERGVLPEALLNHVALLGWHPGGGDTREVFSLPQLCAEFRLDEVSKSDAVVLEHKRRWIEGKHLRAAVLHGGVHNQPHEATDADAGAEVDSDGKAPAREPASPKIVRAMEEALGGQWPGGVSGVQGGKQRLLGRIIGELAHVVHDRAASVESAVLQEQRAGWPMDRPEAVWLEGFKGEEAAETMERPQGIAMDAALARACVLLRAGGYNETIVKVHPSIAMEPGDREEEVCASL